MGALIVFLFYSAGALAMHESRDDLFQSLRKAGYSEVIELPVRMALPGDCREPYLMKTGSHGLQGHQHISQELKDVKAVASLSYNTDHPWLRPQIQRSMVAYQVNSVLVCYRQRDENIHSKKVGMSSKYKHCFLFPQQVDEVVGRIEREMKGERL